MKWFENDLFSNSVFLGAFWGASMVFLFNLVLKAISLLTSFLSKQLNRKKLHLNSLHRLILEFNMAGGTLNDNIYAIKGMLDAFKKYNVTFNKIATIPLSYEYYNELLDIDFINELYEYHSYIRKLNYDIKSLNYGYEKLLDAYTQNNNEIFYKVNIDSLVGEYQAILNYQIEMQNLLKILFAKVRIMQRKNVPLVVKFERLFTQNKTVKKLEQKELNDELLKFESELKENRDKSNILIKKIREKVEKKGDWKG
jgi:hypothetical protein